MPYLKAIPDKHLQDPEECGAWWTIWFLVPLPALNKYTVCGAKVLQNYFLKTTLEPEGINEDVPAISFAGSPASASPIININGLYASYTAAPNILRPAGPIYPVHKQEKAEHGLVASPWVLTLEAGESYQSQTAFWIAGCSLG